jgi:hypothetical protein
MDVTLFVLCFLAWIAKQKKAREDDFLRPIQVRLPFEKVGIDFIVFFFSLPVPEIGIQ